MDETNKSSATLGLLGHIKNNLILKKIFDDLQSFIALNIVKYNKILQEKIKLNLNDYKEECFKIQIEIIPATNKYGEFIRIPENDKFKYHIYFNNDNQEVQKYNITENDDVRKIKVIIDEAESFNGLFKGCKCIEQINFIKFNRKDIKTMGEMFYGCSSLKVFKYNRFNTINVIDMSYMFYGCCSLIILNTSCFDTMKVNNMSHIFYGCKLLDDLNLSNFNTNNVIYMDPMFNGCSSLVKLGISNFDTSNVKDMSYMFS